MGSRKFVIRLKVREICESREPKINMSKLSRMSDVQYNTIRSIFDNPTRDVLLSTLEKIATALRVPVNELYEVIPDE
jgi:DNA-binding Xre family transcriptional regulator